MLSTYDEFLFHQVPTTFDQTDYSDHRFFDRLVIGGHNECGGLDVSVVLGLAAYKNMNTFEGFGCAMMGQRQFNTRFSRSLLPDATALSVNRLRVEVVKPLQTLRAIMEPGDGEVAFDLTIDGILPAREEEHHFLRRHGRTVMDYRRFAQFGRLAGTLHAGGRDIEVSDWFGWRDHSWGVRPGVGGYEPAPGPHQAQEGRLFMWLGCIAGDIGAHFQVTEDGVSGARISVPDGYVITGGDAASEVAVVEIEHDLSFHPGTRVFSRARFRVTASDGRVFDFDIEPMNRPWAFKGTGYSGGYVDGKGLGWWRGDVAERDRYDLSDPSLIVHEDGRREHHWHRETPSRAVVNGQKGYGHCSIFATGTVARYGLETQP